MYNVCDRSKLVFKMENGSKEFVGEYDVFLLEIVKWYIKYGEHKEEVFVDGYGRQIQLEQPKHRNALEELLKDKKRYERAYVQLPKGDWYNPRTQRTRSSRGYAFRHQAFRNVNQARRMESMLKFDDEYRDYCKVFHISPNVLDKKNPPRSWWSEKGRRTIGCWKHQTKSRHQYRGDDRTNRKYEEEVWGEEFDELLAEDFLRMEEFVCCL